jgi:hypothetical protein
MRIAKLNVLIVMLEDDCHVNLAMPLAEKYAMIAKEMAMIHAMDAGEKANKSAPHVTVEATIGITKFVLIAMVRA